MTVLLVLFTLILFLVADHVVQKARLAREERLADSGQRPILEFPAGFELAVNHTWVSRKRDGSAVVGLDEFLSRLVGTVEKIILPGAGAKMVSSAIGITLRDGNRQISLALPVQGRVVEVNHAVLKDPGLATSDPYGRGWLVRVDPRSKNSSAMKLVDTARASEWLKEQVSLAKEFLAARMPEPALMQDGGLPVNGLLKCFDAPVWQEFQKSFVPNS
jgi:glycine cleavage system H protein